MKPVDMISVHTPPDSIGDCFRCCIASILELPAAAVPHFYDGEAFTDESGAIGKRRLLEFLKPLGYFFFELEFEEEWLPKWNDYLACHYTISGRSPRGFRHTCVAYGGRMVHDPHPSRAGIISEDGKYLLGFIVKA